MNSSRCSVALRRGRSRRARSRPNGCGVSALLMAGAADDPESQARIAAFLQGLDAIGLDRRPQRADRHPLERTAMPTTFARHAAELVALAPDVILAATGTATCGAVATGDPHRANRVHDLSSIRSAPASSTSLARPGGNATGFLMFEYGLSGKWLELLKQIAPGVTRVAVLRDRWAIGSGIGQFGRDPGGGAVVWAWS